MTLDMQAILKDAPPIGFKKDQFTPFGKWLVDSKDRDAHIARQAALQALDAVREQVIPELIMSHHTRALRLAHEAIDKLREQIGGR